MDELDRIFKAIAETPGGWSTLIACFSTGQSLPRACAPMPREPEPPGGQLIEDLRLALGEVLAGNAAVHDGAIMLLRATPNVPYKVSGWSYRLFAAGHSPSLIVNRGSAFHSCLAMSGEPDVDIVYLISAGLAYRFSDGAMALVE